MLREPGHKVFTGTIVQPVPSGGPSSRHIRLQVIDEQAFVGPTTCYLETVIIETPVGLAHPYLMREHKSVEMPQGFRKLAAELRGVQGVSVGEKQQLESSF